MWRELGDRDGHSRTLVDLGDAHDDMGNLDAAQAAWQQALDTLEALGHPDAERVRAKLRTA